MSTIFTNQVLRILFIVTDQDGNIENLSTVTSVQIILKGPKGKRQVKTATLTTDGTDGQMHYDTVSGDLDISGNWVAQALITDGVAEYPADILEFSVEDRV